jgi:hypothetical protein
MVIDVDLPLGLIANTAAVLALTLGYHIDLLGPDLRDGDGSLHVGITRIPVPILKGDAAIIKGIREKASASSDLFVVDITDAAQTTTTYDAYETKLQSATGQDLCYLGIALFGPKKAVSRLTGNLGLLR